VKRKTAHLLFGAAALCFACGAGYHIVSYRHAVRVNGGVSDVSVAQPDSGKSPGQAPEVQLALGSAQARSGNHDAALTIYKALIQGNRPDIRRAALFNLGNLYLTQALSGVPTAARSLPLIELAKQSYRTVLRENPGDWDARYNLERALWLAPEASDRTSEDDLAEGERMPTTLRRESTELP
jgi:mxaK protein